MKSVVLLQLLAVPVMWANLLTNGGFEQPLVTGATSESFPVGSTDIRGWLVVPFPPADVSLVRDDFTADHLTFLPHSGVQSLNLTGDISGEAAGVLQKVKLQMGDEYELTFWVGNQDNSAAHYSMDATVGLVVDDNFVHMYTNGDNSHHALNWKEFSYTFTPAKTSTSIEFENLTLPNEYYVGLDDASLVDLTPHAGTPEPNTLWLAGMTLWAAGRRGRIFRRTLNN